jgi:signal peptidase II
MNQLSKRQGIVALTIILAILVIDQMIKLWIKTHLCLDESIHVTDWFYIRFIENEGMAWGMTFFNKLVLSVFRIIAVSLIGWYLYRVIQRGKSRMCYIVLLSMVLAGAAGNIIDSMFYGLVFSGSSTDFVSYLVPFGSGYGDFLTGKVVDMFYFPIIVSKWPDWFPFWGGQDFVFFSAIFNFADAAISVGVIAMLLFCRSELAEIGEKLERDKDKNKAKNKDKDIEE